MYTYIYNRVTGLGDTLVASLSPMVGLGPLGSVRVPRGPKRRPKTTNSGLRGLRCFWEGSRGVQREAQRLQTRGLNPTPIEPARSKRCLPLSTKTQNIFESASIWAPKFGHVCYLFPPFSPKVLTGGQGRAPKCSKCVLSERRDSVSNHSF